MYARLRVCPHKIYRMFIDASKVVGKSHHCTPLSLVFDNSPNEKLGLKHKQLSGHKKTVLSDSRAGITAYRPQVGLSICSALCTLAQF